MRIRIPNTLLLSTIAGAAVGYIIGKSNLRREIASADTPREALDALARTLRQDSVSLTRDLRGLLHSPRVHRSLRRIVQRTAQRRHARTTHVTHAHSA